MSTAQTVREVVEQVVVRTATEREKAIALHDYVRDHVKFGFTKYFDAAEPDYTLTCGVGHCNPKSRLMVALFQAVGLESYQHYVAIWHAVQHNFQAHGRLLSARDQYPH